MKIAIDFDGVLAKHEGINRRHEFAKLPPVENSVDAIWWMLEKGYDVYVLTARVVEEHPLIKWWLNANGFPPLEVTNVKKLGTTIIIDDRCVRFTNWQDVCKLLGGD